MTVLQTGRIVAAQATGLTKVYGRGDTAVQALAGVSLSVEHGRFTAIMGRSGSGKSTLMHCLAGLDSVTEGTVEVGGVELSGLSDRQLTQFRREHVGFVFQAYNLLPMLTAKQNILLPLDLAGREPDWAWFDRLVGVLGIGDRLMHRPSQLSGGQQQRVAIARGLVSRPDILFADEPTGNLDSRTGAEILGLLRDTVDSLGQTTVMVTHDPQAAAIADRILFLDDGHVVRDQAACTAREILATMEELAAS